MLPCALFLALGGCHKTASWPVLSGEMNNMTDVNEFESYRPLMFSIAYRMLGSATEAEDIVQEAYLRYQAAAPGTIVSPKAFLSTIVTRLCLNQLQSARAQRETYIGPWLPEPIFTETDERANPSHQAEMHNFDLICLPGAAGRVDAPGARRLLAARSL